MFETAPRAVRTSTCVLLAASAAGAVGLASAASDAGAAATAAAHAATASAPQNATVAGDFWVEPPTLVSLGFEWRIAGDADRNATAKVSYRRVGETRWHEALPLLRLQGESVLGGLPRYGGPNHFFHYVAPDMFAGSILNLEPDTAYEARFELADPDGVQGERVRIVTVRTRKEPLTAPSGGTVYNVYPFGYTGPKQQPAFTGLLAAYYLGSDESDHSRANAPRVKPGDTILVHAGLYKDNRFVYSGFNRSIAAYGTPFDGTYYLTVSGTPDKPILIKSAGDGEVIFDGDGCDNLFNLMGGNYNYFDGITVRNTNVAFKLGIKGIAGSSGFTLEHSLVYNVGRVVEAGWSGSKDFYIADNVFIGKHDPQHLQSWFTPEVWAKYPGYPALITSEYAVKVYGQGHVIAHNYVANWHDGIDVDTYGDPDGTPQELRDRVPVSIDIYDNDIYNVADNCIEADGGAHDIRVFENRCFNSAGGALSAQPIFGGPVYFYRNVVYNTTTGGYLKLVDTPAGVLLYQNTFIGQTRFFGPASNVHLLNNLILSDGWSAQVLALRTYTSYSSSDYNGFRLAPGSADAFEWDSPPSGVAADFLGKLETRRFRTLAEYRRATGEDRHSILVDFDAFRNVRAPDKSDPQHLYDPEDFDFRLRPHSRAVDAGVRLPTITDGFTGRAPDLGAYEIGRPSPHYGPRVWPAGSRKAGEPRSVRGPAPQ
ncbi:MAG TPA: hypothetical protein VN730_07900 [Steroidobacteraceae bacterium]|nr:hypothetical protein [Steroidobacteraceae bacterium]